VSRKTISAQVHEDGELWEEFCEFREKYESKSEAIRAALRAGMDIDGLDGVGTLDQVAEQRELARDEALEEVVEEWRQYREEFGPLDEAHETSGDWLIMAQNAALLVGFTLAVAAVLATVLVPVLGVANIGTTVATAFLYVLTFLFVVTGGVARLARATSDDWWDREDSRLGESR
jgi:hypothetical protein